MVAFIRQQKLENRTVENILQISEFGFAAWDFLSSIYESGWDKLTANKDNRSFRQYIVSQFNMKTIKSNAINNSVKDNSAKGTNISRILSSIPSRPSKSVLEKSKFFNKNSVANSTFKFSK